MHETMYDCYQSQFACMGRILAKKDVYVSGFAKLYRQTAPTRLYLIGSGSSFNACAAARPVMEQLLGIEVTALAPTQLGKAYGERPLAIVLSQGGHSTNTIAVIQQLKKQGIPVCLLYTSSVAGAADHLDVCHHPDQESGKTARLFPF